MAAHIYTALRELEAGDCTVTQFRHAQSYAQLGDNLEYDHWQTLYHTEDDVMYKAIAVGYIPFYRALWQYLGQPRTAEEWAAARWGDNYEAVRQFIEDYHNPPPPPPPVTGKCYTVGDIAWEFIIGCVNEWDPSYIDDYDARKAELIADIVDNLMPDETPPDDDEIEALIFDDLAAFSDFYESYGDLLYGDWIRTEDGEWVPDKDNPRAQFAFTHDQGRAYIYVNWSDTVVDNEYVLPDWALYRGNIGVELSAEGGER